MKLFTYGDSWTEGQGVNPLKESSFESREDRKKFRNDRSWPKKLSNLLNVNHENQSLSGSDNNTIFNQIITDIKSKKITSGDLVIIMWSSSLRDEVPFFPKGEWHTWGLNYISDNHKHKWFTKKDLTNNSIYNGFLTDFKEFFINELYTQDYYNIVNQNYILFIQNLCDYYHINYIFCDAFDRMIDNIKIENDRTNLINKESYWGFGKRTFKDLLISIGNKNVWETKNFDIMNVPGMHPSEFGYELIADELFTFLNDNINIIKYNNETIIKKLL
jgi:hypothetical protein